MNKINYRAPLNKVLLPMLVLLLVAGIIISCGKNNVVAPTNTNTKLLIVNTSPDVGPVAAYINNAQLGGTDQAIVSRLYYRFTTTPSYYSIGSGSLLIQLRTDHNAALTSNTDTIKPNRNYSLFLMGLKVIDSLRTVFLQDSSSTPHLGRGKVRFVNASPRTPALDVTANGTAAFTKVAYAKAADYIELPAGTYDFKLTANGAPASILTDLPRITILDGKFYTLYSKGLVGHTDTAAISLNIINNVQPLQ